MTKTEPKCQICSDTGWFMICRPGFVDASGNMQMIEAPQPCLHKERTVEIPAQWAKVR